MKNNLRLIDMNQWGDLLYIGKYNKGGYNNWGDFAENLETPAIEEIMQRLYYFEESFEELIEKINQLGNINPISPDELKEVMKNANK